MKIILMVSFLVLFTGPGNSAQAEGARYRGWYAVVRELSSRIAPAGEALPLENYLPAEGLEPLMGTWLTFGKVHEFRNGDPNPLNMLLWHVTLADFSRALAGSCNSPKLALHPRFSATLTRICSWPAASARSDDAMVEYWLAVMGFAAPEEEFLAWRDFFRSSYANRTAGETIEAMTLAILLNPYFLLQP